MTERGDGGFRDQRVVVSQSQADDLEKHLGTEFVHKNCIVSVLLPYTPNPDIKQPAGWYREFEKGRRYD